MPSKQTFLRALGALSAVGAFLCSAGAGAQGPATDRLADPVRRGNLSVHLLDVADGLTAPNWGTAAPGDRTRLFVTDQTGVLWAVDLATGGTTVFADLSGLLVPLGIAGPGTFDERGLLGVAFHPGYADNGLLYTYTSEPAAGPADFSTLEPDVAANHQSVVREWTVPDPAAPDSVVDPGSSRVLLRVDQPQFNHNGGALNFGPDGRLYISLGDGGGRDDQGPGHGIAGNGQDPATVLGSILRIDPDGADAANGQYGIPADNPFVGAPGAAAEVYAYGFRNPFRFSFDRARGDLYVGDVGQDDLEEIDVAVAGGNYGWNIKEGSFCFDPDGDGPGFAFAQSPCPGEGAGLIDPIAEYNTADDLANNSDGRAVVGGFVYRGERIRRLAGRYVFGDFSLFTESGVNNAGRLFYLQRRMLSGRQRIRSGDVRELRLRGRERLGLAVLGFGQDADGELYLLANATGTPFGAGVGLDEPTGVVLRIAPDPADGVRYFSAELSPGQEVPPVSSDASGDIRLRFDREMTRADYRLSVRDGSGIVQAHFHCGPAGVNGPVVAFLFGPAGGGIEVDGELAEATLSDADITAGGENCRSVIGMAIRSVADLAQAAQAGKLYANVHSLANPGGDIRGQITANR